MEASKTGEEDPLFRPPYPNPPSPYPTSSPRRCNIFLLVLLLLILLLISIAIPLTISKLKNSKLEDHRTVFHFQPQKYWMNDPNGMMFFNGYYHLFYQYNPTAAIWGNITWGHAVSKDLIHWTHLKIALKPDHWYDSRGIWTGSATIVEGKPFLIYTGCTNASVQVQNRAFPVDLSDPYLQEWIKESNNPILVPPAQINVYDFRDPTTAWIGHDKIWRILVGSQKNGTGCAFLYKSSDFLKWESTDHPIHSVNGTGMWECPDFYPVSLQGKLGLNTSDNGEYVKHVLKASTESSDSYMVGTYDRKNDTFLPDDQNIEDGVGFVYDSGRFYASKTFDDYNKQRRILFGWISEADDTLNDISKGWASVQSIPRVIWLDKTDNRLVQWPVEEVEKLRKLAIAKENLILETGKTTQIGAALDLQMDMEVNFKMDYDLNLLPSLNQSASRANETCSWTGSTQGSFGLFIISSQDQQQNMRVYFRLYNMEGRLRALFCTDPTRSSQKSREKIYGKYIDVMEEGMILSLRVLIDHSIVECFAQNGKAAITSRVYPRSAAGYTFVYNDAPFSISVVNISLWQMQSLRFNTIL